MKELKFLFVLMVMFGFTGTGNASITDVSIVPEAPTTFDVITIITEGVEGYGGVSITDSFLNTNETLIELDIHLVLGAMTILTPWSHSEDIGKLSEGTYDFTVRTYENSKLLDSYNTTFEVVPEPGTFALFGTGIFWLLRKNRTK